MMKFRVSTTLRRTIFAFLMLSTVAAMAAENGQVHYPIGVNSIMNAALPAPGETGFYHYFQYYQSNRLNDAHGNSLDPKFQADVLAWAPRVVHTWNEMLGPFFIASGMILPITRVDLHAFGRKDMSTGLSDPVVSPIYLYYVNSTGTFFAYAGPDIYIPAGKYDKDRLANNGLNYWAVAPNASMTWLPTPQWELSTTLYTEFNLKNKATDYRSGNSATLDFNVAYRPLPGVPELRVAVQGYAHKQFTDDEQPGVEFENGNRGQAFALGPQVSYDIAGGKGALLLKYQREFAVENRSLGNRYWFEVAIPF